MIDLLADEVSVLLVAKHLLRILSLFTRLLNPPLLSLLLFYSFFIETVPVLCAQTVVEQGWLLRIQALLENRVLILNVLGYLAKVRLLVPLEHLVLSNHVDLIHCLILTSLILIHALMDLDVLCIMQVNLDVIVLACVSLLVQLTQVLHVGPLHLLQLHLDLVLL